MQKANRTSIKTRVHVQLVMFCWLEIISTQCWALVVDYSNTTAVVSFSCAMCNKFAICAHYSSLFLKLRFHKTHISLFINGLSPWVEYAECWEVLQMSNRLRLLSLWSFAWKHADTVGLRATWHIPLHWMKCLINCPKHVDRRINRDYFIIKLRSFFYYMRSPFSCWSWTERVRGGGSRCSRFQLKTWWIHDRPLARALFRSTSDLF